MEDSTELPMGHCVQFSGDSPCSRFLGPILHCTAALDGQPRHGDVLRYRGSELLVAKDLLVSGGIASLVLSAV